MSKRRRRYYKARGTGYPKYNFPGCSTLVLFLVALAAITILGTVAASSDAAQGLAHGQVQAVQP